MVLVKKALEGQMVDLALVVPHVEVVEVVAVDIREEEAAYKVTHHSLSSYNQLPQRRASDE